MKALPLALAITLVVTVTAAFAVKADAETVTLSLGPNLLSTSTIAAQPKPIGSVATCRNPNRAASIDGPSFADYPMVPQAQGVEGTTDLRIDLATNGALTHAAVMDSSGDTLLDNEALRTAKLTSFSPELHGCQAIAGSYMLAVTFSNA